MLFFPELFIANKLYEFQDELYESIKNNATNNLVNDMFVGVSRVGEIDYKQEAISFFSKKRPLEVKIGLNLDTVKFPSVQIYLPAENQSRSSLSIDPEIFSESETLGDEDFLVYYRREKNSIYYNANYSIAILSTNADQVSYLYHILRWMFQRYMHIFEVNGFEKFNMKGADMRMEQTLVPQTIFMRTLTLDFDYEVTSINKLDERVGISLKPNVPRIDIKTKLGE